MIETKSGLCLQSDLFYRISTIVLELPPLRERKEDIPLFIDFYMQKYCREMNKTGMEFAPGVREMLEEYNYPGNIRELKNLIERLLVLSPQDCIKEEYLPSEVINFNKQSSEGIIRTDYTESLREYRQKAEKKYICDLMRKYPDDMNKVSEILSITRRQLLNKMLEYDLK